MPQIADDHRAIKRQMRALGLSIPFDKPEYEADAKAKDEEERLAIIRRWFAGSPYPFPTP